MVEFIREAGWGIYPVLLFGGVSLAVSLRYAIAPRRELLPLVIGFAVATVIAGLLGAVTGIQTTVRYVGEVAASERWLFLVGLRESLNNVVAALCIATIDALLATAGAYRFVRGVVIGGRPAPIAD